MSDTRRARETATARRPEDEPPSGIVDSRTDIPRSVGVVWALLLINTLGTAGAKTLLPIPRPVIQMITLGALLAAFGLALVLNPRVRVRPSAYLLLLSLLAVVSIASSIWLESGPGSLYRCFRLVLFVVTLWLLSGWWRGGLRFANYHLYALGAVLLTVLIGLVIAPGSAFSGPGGRLVGVIWPIPAPQVGQYGAVATGLAILLWLTRNIDGRSAAVISVPGVGLLLLSHTRTALFGMVTGLALAGLSLAFANARARRALGITIGLGTLGAVVFGQVVMTWLRRGQDADELADLTGRQKVWNALLGEERSVGEQILGVGLTDKSFGGLPIDNSWLAIYHEQGWLGIAIVVTILGVLITTAALRPPSPARACAVFLIFYCIAASYTEAGLGDASPYLLHLALAASLLAHSTGTRHGRGATDG
ncbi:MAG: O-antigen ligase domain-containing protein [Pseudonocardiaceae bacterium]